jgi:hypothetical protein
MKNTYQILTIISVLAVIMLFAIIVFKMPSQVDHKTILDAHHKRIDSLIERIDTKVDKIDSLEAQIIELSNNTSKSTRIYNTYKLNIDELIKNYPKRNTDDLDKLRDFLTNIK